MPFIGHLLWCIRYLAVLFEAFGVVVSVVALQVGTPDLTKHVLVDRCDLCLDAVCGGGVNVRQGQQDTAAITAYLAD